MQKLFYEVSSLDKRCYEEFFLSEDILMEQASNALVKQIKKVAYKKNKILFICGSGDNGADGITAARILSKDYEVSIYMPLGSKSDMAKLQLKRAKSLHVRIADSLESSCIYVDCIFGSGLTRDLDKSIVEIIDNLNAKEGIKISCDIPTGIDASGNIRSVCFKTDITITMGALKEALYSDIAKDFVGNIKVANLGLSCENYELSSDSFVLEKKDLKLPFRNQKSSHKGDYGHVSVIRGEKEGASILAATSAFNFGAGLVSIVSKKNDNIPIFIMHSQNIPKKSKVIVVGMGLGKIYDDIELNNFLLADLKTVVVDADLFYKEIIIKLLDKKDDIILTPHPKEFVSLLKILGLADISVKELQEDRFRWARVFSKNYPKAILLLKGANTIITKANKLYINPLGSSKLAKGGSGDILAGMIGSLVAQGYSPLHSTINASLAHALASKKLKYANYALNPIDLCEGIKWL